jgi:serine/threonine protein kinase
MSGLIGQKLGRYQILEMIGEGGMATVYKAHDTHLGREVAVKIIRREDPDASGYRIARGGSWNIFGGTGGNIRIDTRFKLDPNYYGAYVGVRCALTK